MKHLVWATDRVNLTINATYSADEETQKMKKREPSQNRNISPPNGGAIFLPIFTKFPVFE